MKEGRKPAYPEKTSDDELLEGNTQSLQRGVDSFHNVITVSTNCSVSSLVMCSRLQ